MKITYIWGAWATTTKLKLELDHKIGTELKLAIPEWFEQLQHYEVIQCLYLKVFLIIFISYYFNPFHLIYLDMTVY